MSRRLRLERPLVVFDLETTGTSRRVDRIVEIAIIRREVSGEEKTYRSLVNPGISIPPEVIAVHGIDDAAVKDAPRFEQIADEVLGFFAGADIVGYNVLHFDLPFLAEEFRRVNRRFDVNGRHVIDPLTIFRNREPHSLAAAVKFFCGRELENAHSALADTRATLDVLDGQVARYEDLPESPAELHALCNKPRRKDSVDSEGKFIRRHGQPAFNFGKYEGMLLSEVREKDPRYLDWIVDKSEMSEEVKSLVRAGSD